MSPPFSPQLASEQVSPMKTAISLMILAASAVSVPLAVAGDAAAGKAKSTVCASCHGADGNSTIPANPRLAGQYETYLYRALTQYKSGARKNPVMAGMVAGLSDDDMRDLAAFYASQDAALQVLPE